MKMLIVKRNVCGFCGRHVGGGRMGKLPFGPAICPACAGLPIDALLGANGGQQKSPRSGHCEGTEKCAGDDSAPVPNTQDSPRSQDRPLIYLAGPYSAPEHCSPEEAKKIHAFRAAEHARAAAHLKSLGSPVLSPVVMGHAIADGRTLAGDYAGWEEECLAMLHACKAVVVLNIPGMYESRGLDAELGVAARLGLPVRVMSRIGNIWTFRDFDVSRWLHGEC